MKILVPAGIGDNIWLLQKLITTGEKYDFILANDQPHRGKQIFDLLPQVVNSSEYGSHGSNVSIKNNIQSRKPYWHQIQGDIFLSCNTHLEQGNRIESFFPDLNLDFFPEWQTDVTEPLPEGKLIGIYGSCYTVNRHWNFWLEDKWLEFIKMKAEKHPDATFVVIGADFDIDLSSKILEVTEQEGIKTFDCIGKSLGYVIEIMKRLDTFYSFPSGLGILAATVKCPTLMFYPPHLKPMIGTWASPVSIEKGIFKESLFCEPEEANEIL